MKKFFTTGNIALLIYAVLCYVALVFAPKFITDPQDHTQVCFLLVTQLFLSLLILNTEHSEIKNHNEHQLNRESLIKLAAALLETNAIQKDLSDKLGQLSVNVYANNCTVDRIEKAMFEKPVKKTRGTKKSTEVPTKTV